MPTTRPRHQITETPAVARGRSARRRGKARRAHEMLADLHAIGIHVADRHDGEPLRLASLRAVFGLKNPRLLRTGRRPAKAARQYHVTVAFPSLTVPSTHLASSCEFTGSR